MKPFKHEIQKKKWDKLRKKNWTTLSLAILGGAGVATAIIVPIYACKPNAIAYSMSTTAPLLKDAGDEFSITVKTNSTSPKSIVLDIDDSCEDLFAGPTPKLSFVSGYASGNDLTWRNANFENKVAIFTIKVLSPLDSNEDVQFIHYDVHGWGESGKFWAQDGHFIFESSVETMLPEEINNYNFKFSSISGWEDEKPDVTKFNSWLGSNTDFSQYLPILTEKINFNPSDTQQTVFDKLRQYDNSASILATIIADVYYSITASSGDDYKSTGVNVFGIIGTTQPDTYGVETQKFNLSLQQKGTLTNEIINDIFLTTEQNISASWSIEWASWMHYSYDKDYGTYEWHDLTHTSARTGTFTGMQPMTSNVKSSIKVIYDGIVGTWPTGW